jgi:hypothetical protein
MLSLLKISSKNNLGSMNNIYDNIKEIKESLSKKPYIFINKYGDMKILSKDEFNDISKSDSIFPYFEKLSILNNKNDILLLNDYDFSFFIYLDSKNINYTHNTFKIFRKMFHLVNFFNIKFYVATPEHSKFLSMYNLKPNNVYLIKRDNMLQTNMKKDQFEFESENLVMMNLSEDLNKLNEFILDDSKLSFINII